MPTIWSVGSTWDDHCAACAECQPLAKCMNKCAGLAATDGVHAHDHMSRVHANIRCAGHVPCAECVRYVLARAQAGLRLASGRPARTATVRRSHMTLTHDAHQHSADHAPVPTTLARSLPASCEPCAGHPSAPHTPCFCPGRLLPVWGPAVSAADAGHPAPFAGDPAAFPRATAPGHPAAVARAGAPAAQQPAAGAPAAQQPTAAVPVAGIALRPVHQRLFRLQRLHGRDQCQRVPGRL